MGSEMCIRDRYNKNNQDVNSVLDLKDKNGILLINKHKDNLKHKVMKLKIDEFKKKGFNNIVLSGHSAGAKSSFVLKPTLKVRLIDFTILLFKNSSSNTQKKCNTVLLMFFLFKR